MVVSHTTQFSKRCSKDVLSTFSKRLSDCVLWVYLNMIEYRKILIGHFMTSYEILRSPFGISLMLLSGICVGSPLSIWDNLGYPQDKVCCVGYYNKKHSEYSKYMNKEKSDLIERLKFIKKVVV